MGGDEPLVRMEEEADREGVAELLSAGLTALMIS